MSRISSAAQQKRFSLLRFAAVSDQCSADISAVVYRTSPTGSILAAIFAAMSKRGPIGISQSKTIEALQQALDQTYRQMLKAAQEDWQLLFADQDLGNSSVSVRTSKAETNDELTATPRRNVMLINAHKRAQRF